MLIPVCGALMQSTSACSYDFSTSQPYVSCDTRDVGQNLQNCTKCTFMRHDEEHCLNPTRKICVWRVFLYFDTTTHLHVFRRVHATLQHADLRKALAAEHQVDGVLMLYHPWSEKLTWDDPPPLQGWTVCKQMPRFTLISTSAAGWHPAAGNNRQYLQAKPTSSAGVQIDIHTCVKRLPFPSSWFRVTYLYLHEHRSFWWLSQTKIFRIRQTHQVFLFHFKMKTSAK